ncbi:MAG: hypothetical protein ACR2PI_28115 [Hyphomicrobiaceae bacterium]
MEAKVPLVKQVYQAGPVCMPSFSGFPTEIWVSENDVAIAQQLFDLIVIQLRYIAIEERKVPHSHLISLITLISLILTTTFHTFHNASTIEIFKNHR